MDDCLGAGEGEGDRVRIANVAHLQLHRRVKVAGPLALRMHLFVEVVERADSMAMPQQLVGDVGANKACSSGNDDAHRTLPRANN